MADLMGYNVDPEEVAPQRKVLMQVWVVRYGTISDRQIIGIYASADAAKRDNPATDWEEGYGGWHSNARMAPVTIVPYEVKE